VFNVKGELGARRDTVIAIPNQSVKIAILADIPGTGRCTATPPITQKLE